MRRTLRFVRGIGTLGWRPVILTVRNQDYLREPTEEIACDHIPETASVYRTRVRRPLELALCLRDRWRRLTRSKNHSSGQQASGAQGDPASSPGARSWVQRWIDPWFSTPDAQVGWLPSAVWKGWRAIGPEGVAVIYSSGPPYSAHLIAWALKKLSGRPWVADFRDPWSRRPWDQDIVNRTPRYRVQVWMERVVVLAADTLISNTRAMGEDFRDRYPDEPRDKFVVITNGYDPETLPKPTREPSQQTFNITHTGAIYGRRDARPIIRALAQIRDAGNIQPGFLNLKLVGKLEAEAEVQAMIQSLDLADWVTIVPEVSFQESIRYLARSQVLLVLQPDAPLQIPGKLFEYIYLKKPILALTGEGATAEIIRQYRLGEVVPPDDPERIAGAIAQLYQDSHESRVGPDESALRDFHTATLTAELVSVFESVAASQRKPLVSPAPEKVVENR